MTAALRFVGGDEVIEPFLLEATDGEIIDLTEMQPITGGVWWRGRQRIDLTVGAGIEITNVRPARAASEATQTPHGKVTLTEVQSRLIPFGQIASLRLVAVRAIDTITMSTYFAPLERIT